MFPIRFSSQHLPGFQMANSHFECATHYRNDSSTLYSIGAGLHNLNHALEEAAKASQQDRVEIKHHLAKLDSRLDQIEARLSKSPLSNP